MENEKTNKSIDSERLGANNQSEVQEQVREMNGENVPAKPHDPFPARSSKKAAIKTYKDYAAESLSKGGGSLTKMIIAEREKKERARNKSAANPKNVAMSLLSVVFIVLGLAMVVGAFFLVTNLQERAEEKRIPLTPQPLVLFDYRNEVYIADPTRARIIRAVEKEITETGIEAGAIKYLYFAHDGEFDQKALVTTEEFLALLRAKVSGALTRSLGEIFMYGIYSTTDNSPFLMFTTNNYDATYAELLDWERSMGLDLGDLLGKPDHDYSRSNFVDVVYFNRDARAVLDIEGNVVMGYAFIDRSTIVFFSNKLALREIIDRSQQNTVKE